MNRIFVLARNSTVFVEATIRATLVEVHFSEELQWFRGGHGFISSSESSFHLGIVTVWERTWIGHGVSRFDPRYEKKVSMNS